MVLPSDYSVSLSSKFWQVINETSINQLLWFVLWDHLHVEVLTVLAEEYPELARADVFPATMLIKTV